MAVTAVTGQSLGSCCVYVRRTPLPRNLTLERGIGWHAFVPLRRFEREVSASKGPLVPATAVAVAVGAADVEAEADVAGARNTA